MAEEHIHLELEDLFHRTQEYIKSFAEFSEIPFVWSREVLDDVKALTDPQNSLLPRTPCMKRMRCRKLPLISETEETTVTITSETRKCEKNSSKESFEEKQASQKRTLKRNASTRATKNITLSLMQEKIDPSKKSNKDKIVSLSNALSKRKSKSTTTRKNSPANDDVLNSSNFTGRCLRPRVKKSVTKKPLRSKAKKSIAKIVSEKPKTPQEARAMLRHVHLEKKCVSKKKVEVVSPFQTVKDRVHEYSEIMAKSTPVSKNLTSGLKRCAQTTVGTAPKSQKKDVQSVHKIRSEKLPPESNDCKQTKLNLPQSASPSCLTDNNNHVRLSKIRLSAKKSIKPTMGALRLSSHLTLIKASKMSESQRRSSLMRHRLRISREYLARTNSLSVANDKKCNSPSTCDSTCSSSFHDSGKNTTQEELDEKSDLDNSDCSLKKQKLLEGTKAKKRSIINLIDYQNESNAKVMKMAGQSCVFVYSNDKKLPNGITSLAITSSVEKPKNDVSALPDKKNVKLGDSQLNISNSNLQTAVVIVNEQEREICSSFLENIPQLNTDNTSKTPLKPRYKSVDCTSSGSDSEVESCSENTPVPYSKILLPSGHHQGQKQNIFNSASKQVVNQNTPIWSNNKQKVSHGTPMWSTKQKISHGSPMVWSTGKAHQNLVSRLALKTTSSTSRLMSDHSVSRIASANVISCMSTFTKTQVPSRERSSKDLERQRLLEINKKFQHEEEILKKRNKLLEMKVQEQKRKREERMQKVAEARRKMEQEKENRMKLKYQFLEEKLAKTELEKAGRIREELLKKQTWKMKRKDTNEQSRLQEEECHRTRLREQDENEKLNQSEKTKECERLRALLHNSINLQKVPSENMVPPYKPDVSSVKDGFLHPLPLINSQPTSDMNVTYVSNNMASNSESYEITPHRAVRSSCYNYDISDLKSDDESEDEDEQHKKPIPGWAQGIRLKESLIQQYYNPPDIDAIFGDFPILALENIFAVKRKRFLKRTSSAVWASSPINSCQRI